MNLFIVVNSLLLFVLMQILGVPISNLAVLKDKYDKFSFSDDETTSGINIIYNIMLSNIYILILYELPVSNGYHNELYLITIGYLIIRYCFLVFILGRASLLNLRYELTLIILTLIVTYFVHTFIIIKKISMFIPIEDFKNELLLLLVLFLYDVFKNGLVRLFNNRDSTSRRKSYIRTKYSFFKTKHGELISENIKNDPVFQRVDSIKKQKFILMVYSFLIYETFARPKPYRLVENIFSRISSKTYSTGVMQIQSNTPLSDEASIIIGMSILKPLFEKHYYPDSEGGYWINPIANNYNPSTNGQYANEIQFIYNELVQFTGIDT